MFNWLHKILKSIYVYIGFKLPYYWAEAFFPNRTVYAAMLISKCSTMKQFRERNEFLVNVLMAMNENQKFKIKSIRDLSDYLKSSMSQEHKDHINNYIEKELGININ